MHQTHNTHTQTQTNQDVLRFDILMHDAPTVQMLDAFGDIHDPPDLLSDCVLVGLKMFSETKGKKAKYENVSTTMTTTTTIVVVVVMMTMMTKMITMMIMMTITMTMMTTTIMLLLMMRPYLRSPFSANLLTRKVRGKLKQI